MDILSYRKKHQLSQAQFADLFPKEKGKTATQGLVWQWENDATGITAERAIQIEELTGGEISRSDLRPDLWPRAA